MQFGVSNLSEDVLPLIASGTKGDKPSTGLGTSKEYQIGLIWLSEVMQNLIFITDLRPREV